MQGRATIGKPDLNRLRVRFGKDGRLAFLGHLEVINTIGRSIRRAQLPFSVGNGFAQRMRIQFSQALPVGAASRAEYVDIYLTERIDAKEALRRFAEALGLTLANCMAFGDGGNDLTMVEAAGVGVAMANACPEVLAAADYTTLSNDEDGVAAALRKFLSL